MEVLRERMQTERRPDVPEYKKDTLSKFVGFLNAAKLAGADVRAAVIGPSYMAKIKLCIGDSEVSTFAGDMFNGVRVLVCDAIDNNACFLFDRFEKAQALRNDLLLAKASGIPVDRWLYWKGYRSTTV